LLHDNNNIVQLESSYITRYHPVTRSWALGSQQYKNRTINNDYNLLFSVPFAKEKYDMNK